MAWTRTPIESNPDPDSPLPWYKFDVDEANARIEILESKDGGTNFDLTGAVLNFDSINPAEPFRVVVTEAGELTTYNVGETDVPPLRAHLSPATTVQDLTLYEFVEQ